MTGMSSTQVRGDLVDLIEQELLGPREGAEEEILGTPRAQYSVGALAPVTIDPEQAIATTSETAADETGDPAETGEAISDVDREHLPQQGVPVDTDQETGTADDEEDRDEGPKGALTHPSSMGLRFQVPRNCGVLAVIATWGRYEGRRRENEGGRKILYSQRTPFERSVEIDVQDPGEHVILKPIELDDDVTLRVELFPLPDRIIVEIALSNDRVTGMDAPPKDWLFQTKLKVKSNSGGAMFLPTRDAMEDSYDEDNDERRRLDLQYRHRLEFAIGRTCSATWTADEQTRRAVSVETTWLPTADVAQTVPGAAAGAITAMKVLAQLEADGAEAAFGPLIDGYSAWLAGQQAIADNELPEHLRETAEDAIGEAEVVAERLREGMELLKNDQQALQAFQFMNRAMRDQRIHSQVAAARASDESKKINDVLAELIAREPDDPSVASWRPFQLAFVLLQLPALTDPAHPYRSGGAANVELLFFPTGGGKTEAYLGLAAYTFAIRRLQGKVETDDGMLDGGDGVAVLMRYTLRLLTSQQFQRAAALVCAAELIRQEDAVTWGEKPFSIGLWVGSAVSPKRYKDAERQVIEARGENSWRAHGLTVLQLQRCPWCGTKIDPKRDVVADPNTERVRVYCGDHKRGDCAFSVDGDADGALPITTVDDEIYRNPPTFLLATVDKFARLAREGEAASLFGYVDEWCSRHGYRHRDARGGCGQAQSHNMKGKLPKVVMQKVDRLRPPDLIIQDELHLITGALGTAVGVFENAVDLLSSYSREGVMIRPLVVASTATVANADRQVEALYGRGVDVFPPQVLDVRYTYFSEEKPVSDGAPGRKYLGVCAHGIRLTLAEIRLAEVLLLAGQKLLDTHGDAADPYLTTVGYFSAVRELAGMRRYLDDDVTIRVTGNTEPFPRRTTDREGLEIGELTSRISAEDISKTLDKLSRPFSRRWSTQGRAEHRAAVADAKKAGKTPPPWGEKPYDVVLATSMLQVGVDVPRLGLMLVVGQPKNTAEYIQASSRVGRDAKKPGLVVSLANWSRPRDMAHFEQFRHYHETFYAQVEALSVTPYSDTAMERGLMGVLVSVARVSQRSLSAEGGAGQLPSEMPRVQNLVEQLVHRAGPAADTPEAADRMRLKLLQRLDRWHDKAAEANGQLFYERRPQNKVGWPLLISPETKLPKQADRVFVVANSMREVQPEINLLVSPSLERLAFKEPPDRPEWEFPEEVSQ
ncbi:DISARM system helicase DrmA [Amycolatopsis sp. DG1A-15b]|uniref:DISARM system helicase DrmA n=1 Tax=Amycolatopsis sp. DG1A-15b TaxID=3052846 RepID=UPI00255B9F6C|nr:DISARM system helicase DrmA [Amycolatopsis sp. DG1A-15b]WIX85855.1 DISARM system helicase DrmA [Amycolatopsis sp. DG1A-15b]